MTKRSLWILFNVSSLMVLWLAVCAGCSTISDDEPDLVERVRVGDAVPSFTVEVVDGTRRSTFHVQPSALRGTTVIVFFNTSCKDCQRDLPLLNEYYLQHKDEADFQMVAISREEGEESVATYWAANGLQIPYSAQEDRRIYNLFATSIIPRIYFCNDGIVTRIDVEKFAVTSEKLK